MLEELRIRDLGVITDATLPLGPGLSVVTGETGAGKTMVVTAVGLLLGARSDAGAVRSGAKSASAEATVKLDAGHAAVARAREAGADVEEFDGGAELLLARSVGADGRSRAYLGGRAAPVGVLAEIGETLVVVHGQSEQIRLKSPVAQRGALDKFAGEGFAGTLSAYQELHGHWKAIQAELDSLRSAARERLREAESLEAALGEIDAVDPQPGEDDSLKAEAVEARQRRGTADRGNDGAPGSHRGGLRRGQRRHRPGGRRQAHPGACGRTRRGTGICGGPAGRGRLPAQRYRHRTCQLPGIALDTEGPERLAEIEDRRAALAKLVRKYAPSIDEVLVWAEEARARYEELQDDSTRIEALDAEVTRTEAELRKQAAAISKARTQGRQGPLRPGQRRAEGPGHGRRHPGHQRRARPSSWDPSAPTRSRSCCSRTPGRLPGPLGKGASGGELSRVMLAIEVVLAAVDPVPTFVFDEVDAGVGGRAAVEIGRRLAMLARHVQVLVVTHLPAGGRLR